MFERVPEHARVSASVREAVRGRARACSCMQISVFSCLQLSVFSCMRISVFGLGATSGRIVHAHAWRPCLRTASSRPSCV
eukprot:6047217-Pleurochrysis_carterae.AAC.1